MIEPITNFKLGIGIPCSFQTIPFRFFESYLQMEKPDNYVLLTTNSGGLSDMRNDLVKKAFENNCSHLLMLDIDQINPVDTIPKLLKANKHVVSGCAHRKCEPYEPFVYGDLKGDGLHPFTMIPNIHFRWGDLVRCTATSTGCLLVDMRVFLTIPAPWFEFPTIMVDGVETQFAEDIYFCKKCGDAGIEVYVDTSINIGHLNTIVIDKDTYELYNTLNAVKKINFKLN